MGQWHSWPTRESNAWRQVTELVRLLMRYQVTHNKCCKREGAHAHQRQRMTRLSKTPICCLGSHPHSVSISSNILTADEQCPLNERF